MQNTKLRMIIAYVKAYAHEALGVDTTISGDTEPIQILNVLFGSRQNAAKIFSLGKDLHKGRRSNTSQLKFDFLDKKWVFTKSSDTGLDLLSLGVLLEDWDWVNEFNPFDRT